MRPAPRRPGNICTWSVIRAPGRPPTWAMPVTTPSAPKPSCSQLARRASSTKVAGSTSRATRSRTGSLPCTADLSWWRCGPPPRARSRACFRSDIATGNLLADGAQLGAKPAPDQRVPQAHHAGAEDGPGRRQADRRERDGAHREQADPGARLGADDRGHDLASRSPAWVRSLHARTVLPVYGSSSPLGEAVQ